jgi:hypothetical protein
MTSTPLPIHSSPFSSPTTEATARTLISALVHRYASLTRETLNMPLVTPLFHPTAKIHSPDGRDLEPAQLADIMGPEPPKLLRHNVTTVDIQFVSEKEARCLTYVIAVTEKKCPDHFGVWEDVVVREGEKWVFARKEVEVDWVAEGGWLAGVLGALKEAEALHR